MPRKKKRTYICSDHAELGICLDEIRECAENIKPADMVSRRMLTDIRHFIRKANQYLMTAAESGKRMEQRLKKYREAVENLGFTRDKENSD